MAMLERRDRPAAGAGRSGTAGPFARKLHILGPALAAAAFLSASIAWRPTPIVVWNASASSPVGLYAVTSPATIRRGDMVVAWAPRLARRLAAERHYLPFGVPLVKRVAATSGDRVCATATRISVNGRIAAVRRVRDPGGRPMPAWSGCRRLRGRELFLLSPGAPGAFDGRYFGVTRGSEVVGRARLVWPR